MYLSATIEARKYSKKGLKCKMCVFKKSMNFEVFNTYTDTFVLNELESQVFCTLSIYCPFTNLTISFALMLFGRRDKFV